MADQVRNRRHYWFLWNFCYRIDVGDPHQCRSSGSSSILSKSLNLSEIRLGNSSSKSESNWKSSLLLCRILRSHLPHLTSLNSLSSRTHRTPKNGDNAMSPCMRLSSYNFTQKLPTLNDFIFSNCKNHLWQDLFKSSSSTSQSDYI